MKTPIALAVFGTVMIASTRNEVAADAAANWSHQCAACHGKDVKEVPPSARNSE